MPIKQNPPTDFFMTPLPLPDQVRLAIWYVLHDTPVIAVDPRTHLPYDRPDLSWDDHALEARKVEIQKKLGTDPDDQEPDGTDDEPSPLSAISLESVDMVENAWKEHPDALVAVRLDGAWWLMGKKASRRDPFTSVMRYFTDSLLSPRLRLHNGVPVNSLVQVQNVPSSSTLTAPRPQVSTSSTSSSTPTAPTPMTPTAPTSMAPSSTTPTSSSTQALATSSSTTPHRMSSSAPASPFDRSGAAVGDDVSPGASRHDKGVTQWDDDDVDDAALVAIGTHGDEPSAIDDDRAVNDASIHDDDEEEDEQSDEEIEADAEDDSDDKGDDGDDDAIEEIDPDLGGVFVEVRNAARECPNAGRKALNVGIESGDAMRLSPGDTHGEPKSVDWSALDPEENRGIIDTIHLVRKTYRDITEDIENLIPKDGSLGSGFASQPVYTSGTLDQSNGKVLSNNVTYKLYRKEDGVFIKIQKRSKRQDRPIDRNNHNTQGAPSNAFEWTIRVECALPRVFNSKNGTNQSVSAVPADQVIPILRKITCDLFPSTLTREDTLMDEAARSTRLGAEWRVERLDLAANFHGPVATLIEGYRMASTPRVRGKPANSYLYQTVEWLAKNKFKLHIYSRDVKTLRSLKKVQYQSRDIERKQQVVEDETPQCNSLAKGGSRLGRVEVQMASPEALAILTESVSAKHQVVMMDNPKVGCPCLPIRFAPPRHDDDNSNGGRRIGYLLVNYPLLHAVLRREVLALEPVIPHPYVSVSDTLSVPKYRQILSAIAIAQNPGLLEILCDPRSAPARSLRRGATQWRRAIMTPSLLELVWPNHARAQKVPAPLVSKTRTSSSPKQKR